MGDTLPGQSDPRRNRSTEEKENSINWLELRAIKLALLTFQDLIQDQYALIKVVSGQTHWKDKWLSSLGNRGMACITSNKYIKRYLKGTVQLAPLIKHGVPAWSLSKVLQALTKLSFEPLSSIINVILEGCLSSCHNICKKGFRAGSPFSKGYVALARTPLRTDPQVDSSSNLSQQQQLLYFCPRPSCLKERMWH